MITALQLEKHRQFITGSKVASILCLSGAYQSKFQLFAQMKGLVEAEKEETERMKAGQYMESAIAEWCKHEWGWDLIPGPHDGMNHPDYPFIYGLVDRLQKTDGSISHVIEIKNQDRMREKEWQDGPPDYFKSQLFLYMSIFNLPGKFAVCFGGNHFEYFDLPRNPSIESFILKKCCNFWEDLQNDKWPEPDNSESCAETLKRLYDNPNDEMLVGDQELYEIADRYNIFSLNEKQAKENKEKAGNDLRARIGNKQGFLFRDGSKVTWKMTNPKKEKFNEEKFAAEYPELYKKYLFIPNGYRRLNVSLKGA